MVPYVHPFWEQTGWVACQITVGGGGGVGKEENTLLATALLIAKYTWPCMHALA